MARVVGMRAWAEVFIEGVETSLIVAGLALLFLAPKVTLADGWVRFQQLSSLLGQGQLTNTRYSMVGPLFSSPLWYLGRALGDTWLWTSRFNTVVLALGLLGVYLLFRNRLPSAITRRFCLIVVAASMFPDHLLFYYAEVFTAVLVAVGCVMVILRPRIGGWTAIVLGVANTPAAGAGMVVLAGWRVVRSRRVRYVVPVICAAVLIAVEARVRRGSFFDFGYGGVDQGPVTVMPYSGRPGFSLPIFFGLISLIFSFGKGLIWFAPGLLLPVRAQLRVLRERTGTDIGAVYALWIAFFIGILLLYSTYWSWHGGYFWGPRYLLFASIPASFAIAVHLHRGDRSLGFNVVLLVVLALSLWVGIDGVVFGAAFAGDDTVRHYCLDQFGGQFETPLCYYTPEFSVLWFPFVFRQTIAADKVFFFEYELVVAAVLLIPLMLQILVQLAAQVRRVDWAPSRLRF